MFDKFMKFYYGKVPGVIAAPIGIPFLVLFLIISMTLNVKKWHRPLDEWN